MTSLRWLRVLGRSRSVLVALTAGAEAGMHGVYATKDRRRRPLARVTRSQVEAAMQAGWIEHVGGVYRITQAGRQIAGRGAAGTDAGQGERRTGTVWDEALTPRAVTINPEEGAVAKWRGVLSETACAAAEQFLCDYVRSTLHQSVTRNWSPTAPRRGEVRVSGPDDAAVSALAAKDRIFTVLDALGPQFARIIEAALIREESLAAMERRFGWAQRSGRTAIELAFARLAQVYGYTNG